MDRQDLLERYRLALQLIPDRDVAGDLFMEARSEAELRRFAARWRSRHGLAPNPDPGPGSDQPPPLTPDEAEDALHLARRGLLRRRFRRGLATAGAALLIAAVALGGLRLVAQSGLAGARPMVHEPIGLAESGPYRATVSRAEASPGAVTVWWEITGPNLSGGDILAEPQLTLAGSGQDWLRPAFHETTLSRPDRFAARSTFNIPAHQNADVVLQLQVKGIRRPLLMWAPLSTIAAEEGTREVDLPAVGSGPSPLKVSLAPTYTLVRYRAPSPQHFIRVEAPAGPLEPLGPPRITENGEFEAIFSAIPRDTRGRLTVLLERGTPAQTFTEPYDTELAEIVQDGSHLTVQMHFSTYRADPYTVTPRPLPEWTWVPEGAYLTLGDDQTKHALRAVYQGEDPLRRRTLWRLETNLPGGGVTDEIRVWVPRIFRAPMTSFTLNL